MSKQFWIVAPLDCPEKAASTHLRTNAQNNRIGLDLAQEAPRQRAPRRDEVAPEPVQNTGYGYVPDTTWVKKLSHVFTSEESASEYAKELASKNPKTLFGVFGCSNVYETTTPTVVQKQYNEAGELVVKS